VQAKLAEMTRGALRPSAKVGDLLVAWLEARRAEVRPTTWEVYEAHIRLHCAELAGLRLAELTTDRIAAWRSAMLEAGYQPSTVNLSLRILRSALAWGVKQGWLATSPAVGVRVAVPRERRPAAWTPEQAAQFLAATQDRPFGPLWALLLGTGMRIGEALALRWDDIRDGRVTVRATLVWTREGKRLMPPKSRAGARTVTLPGFARQALERLPRTSLFVFGELMPQQVRRQLAADCDLAAVPRISPHGFRHLAASYLLAAGFSLADVQRHLGHASITMTVDLYGHEVAGRGDELAAGLDRVVGR
jgi:integrase